MSHIGRPTAILRMCGTLLIAILTLAPGPALAEEIVEGRGEPSGKAVLVLVDGVSLTQLSDPDLKNFRGLLNEGSIGLMNARSADFFQEGSTYLTIGASSRADARPYGGRAYNAGEILPSWRRHLLELGPLEDTGAEDLRIGVFRADELFFQRTGVKVPESSIVQLGIAGIIDRNGKKYSWPISPGLLGDTLKENGLGAAVVGNADIAETQHRASVLITMDSQGVSKGLVDSSLVRAEAAFLGGYVTDYERLSQATAEWLPKSDFLVVDLGDTARIAYQASLTDAKRRAYFHSVALERADQFLGTIVQKLDQNEDLLIVAVPTPSREMRDKKNYLTPMIVTGPGYSKGVLGSPTTRRHGIVANVDIAPTILDYFNAEVPIEMSGRPVETEAQAEPLDFLLGLSDRLVMTFRTTRPPFLSAFVTVATFALLLTLMAALLGWQKNHTVRTLVSFFLLWLIFIPLSSLFQMPVTSSNTILPVVLNLGLAAAMAIISLRLRPHVTILVVCLSTALALVADSFSGANLMLGSFFGSDPIAGGRYYGMGNTYLGVVIGASLVSVGAWRGVFAMGKRVNLVLTAAFLLAVAVAVGHPSFGANVGGLMTALSAAFITILFLEGRSLGLKWVFLIVATLLTVLTVFLLADIFLVSSQSHAGRAVLLIEQSGFQEVFKIVSRKLSMNLRHLQTNAWSGLMMAAFVLLVMSLAKPPRFATGLRVAYPNIWRGLLGAGAGSLIAFTVNDTGVVAAGTSMLYVIFPLLYLYINLKFTDKTRSVGEAESPSYGVGLKEQQLLERSRSATSGA